MTGDLLPKESQIQKKKPSKKERMAIRKINHQSEVEKDILSGVKKSLLYYGLPFLLGFMAFAISLSLGMFIVGFSGVIVAVKKEMPSGLVTVHGTGAVIVGVLATVLCWSLAAYFFWVEVSIKWWGL